MDRNEAYKALPQNIQFLYDSPESGDILRASFNAHVAQPESYKTYVHIVGDAILGFYKTKDIPKKLQFELNLGADDAQRILTELSSFLAPLIEFEQQEEQRGKAGLQELEQNFKNLREEAMQLHNTSGAETPTRSDPGVEAAVAEAMTDPAKVAAPNVKTSYTVEPMHTMQTDITRIHGYGAYRDLFPDEKGAQAQKEGTIKSASQEELLGKKPELAQKPNYSE